MITNAIVKRVFNYFGVPEQSGTFSLLAKSFLLSKEFTIELDDGEKIQKHIWGAEGKIAESAIRTLIADTTINNDSQEYILLFQLDDLSIYALKYEKQEENFVGKAFFSYQETSWLELTDLMLAKLLVGIEQLREMSMITNYKPLAEYQELYKFLISFMNYEEALQNNQ